MIIGFIEQKKPIKQVSFGCSGCQRFYMPDKSIKKNKKNLTLYFQYVRKFAVLKLHTTGE